MYFTWTQIHWLITRGSQNIYQLFRASYLKPEIKIDMPQQIDKALQSFIIDLFPNQNFGWFLLYSLVLLVLSWEFWNNLCKMPVCILWTKAQKFWDSSNFLGGDESKTSSSGAHFVAQFVCFPQTKCLLFS